MARLPFLALALLGLALSLITHTAAVLGIEQPLGEWAWLLHVGIFVVWLPAILAIRSQPALDKRADAWTAALRGCPVWLRRLSYGFFVYAVLNFALFMLLLCLHPLPRGRQQDQPTPPIVLRGFS